MVLLQASSQADGASALKLHPMHNFPLNPSRCSSKVWPVFPHGHATTVCTVRIVKGRHFCAHFIAGTLDSSASGPQQFSTTRVPSSSRCSRRMLKGTAHAFRGCALFHFFCVYICFVFVCHCWSLMSCDVFGAKTEPLVFLFVCASGHSRGVPQKLSSFEPCVLP